MYKMKGGEGEGEALIFVNSFSSKSLELKIQVIHDSSL